MRAAALQNYDLGPDLTAMKSRLDRDGVIVLEPHENLFSPAEWDLLESSSIDPDLPYEEVLIGDAGEPNLVEVGRLMTDVDRPRVVNHGVSQPMLEALGSKDRLALYAGLLGGGPLHVRRAQINKMHAGSFIGLHVDQDSNPDYSIAIVLQMGSDFSGGEFVVQKPTGETVTVHPTYRTVTISRCDFAHEVRPVRSGVRTSLVYFVSTHAGDNRRHSAALASADAGA